MFSFNRKYKRRRLLKKFQRGILGKIICEYNFENFHYKDIEKMFRYKKIFYGLDFRYPAYCVEMAHVEWQRLWV